MDVSFTQFRTAEEFNLGMKLIGLPYTEVFQTSRGLFNNKLYTINLPKTAIGLCERGASYKQIFQNKKEFFTVVFPNSVEKPIINGKKVLQDGFNVFAPEEYVYCQFGKNSDTLTYYVDKNEMSKLMGDEGLDQFFALSKHKVVGRYQSKQAELFREYLLKVLSMGNCEKMRDSSTAAKDLQDSLFLRIDELCRDFDTTWSKPSFTSQTRILNKVIEYMQSSTNPCIGVSDLSKVVSCTVRNLEYSFMRVMDVSPKKYLTYRRFHLIYSELKSTNSHFVSNVLGKYGVTNTARFSQEYADYFGERPKVTLKKGMFT